MNSSAKETEEMVNISIRKDRELKKNVLLRGDYRLFPREGAHVRVRIGEVSFCDESGDCDADPQSRYFRSDFYGRLEIGSADYFVDEDFERCLQTMSCGETSVLTMEYRDAEGRLARRVSCRTELLDTSDEPALCDWEWTRLLAHATRHKERGVELVRSRRIADAFRRFAKAYKLLMATEPYDMEKIPPERFGDLMELKVKLLNNLAHCQLHYRQFQAALQVCNTLLDIDGYNAKALYRRGAARMGLQEWEAARDDMQLVLHLEPNNPDALHKLTLIRPKVKLINDNYNHVIKKMFT